MKFETVLVIALLLLGIFPVVGTSSAESAYEFDTMGQSEVHIGPGGEGYVNFKLNNEDNTQNGNFKFEVKIEKKMKNDNQMDINKILDKLLEVRGSKPGK